MTATLDSLGLDGLLDSTLDDIADLPSFEPFPAGAHRVLVSMEHKEINEKPSVELELKMLEVLELADPNTAVAPVEGDTCTLAYFLDNEFGLGKFKEVAVPFAAALGVSSLRDVIEQVKDIECVVISNTRPDKKDPERVYMNIKELQIV